MTHPFYILLMFAFWLTPIHLSGQCMQLSMSDIAVVSESSLIVEGMIIEREVFWKSKGSQIYTAYRVSPYSIMKGDVPTEDIWILTKGGQIGEYVHVTFPELSLSIGDVGIFLLQNSSYKEQDEKNRYFKAWAIDQSFYKYDKVSATADNGFRTLDIYKQLPVDYLSEFTNQEVKRLVDFNLLAWLDKEDISHRSSAAITSFTPAVINAGVDELLTINGNNFGPNQGNLLFRNADSTNPNSYIGCPPNMVNSWTNSQIQVRVPNRAGTGSIIVQPTSGGNQFSADDLEVFYNVSSFSGSPSSTLVRYVSMTSAGDVRFQFNNDFATNSSATASFLRAVSTWKCTTGINWQQGTNTSADSTGRDGLSVIRWADPGELTGSTVGQYNGYFFAMGGGDEYCAEEFDVMFEENVSWNYGPALPTGSQIDFETVALHELGHALFMGHISDDTEVMYPSTTQGTALREPGNSATDGALFSMTLHLSYPNSCTSSFALSNLPPIEVTNSNNSGNGSLPQAVIDVCDYGSISFSNSLSGTAINLSGSPITINKNMLINGLGMNLLTLSGNNVSRIFSIDPGIEFTLSNIKLLNANETINGGAFYNRGKTTLNNVILENNNQGSTPKAFSNEPNKEVIIQGDVEVKD